MPTKRDRHVRVACPRGCGGTMQETSQMCQACRRAEHRREGHQYAESKRAARARTVQEARATPKAKRPPRATSPGSPSLRQQAAMAQRASHWGFPYHCLEPGCSRRMPVLNARCYRHATGQEPRIPSMQDRVLALYFMALQRVLAG